MAAVDPENAVDAIIARVAAADLRTETCSSCKCGHFPRLGEMGECRHSPPTVTLVPFQSQLSPNQLSAKTFSGWPPVSPEQWCTSGYQAKFPKAN